MGPLAPLRPVYRHQLGRPDPIVKLMSWEYKQVRRYERRRVQKGLALEAQANVEKETLRPDQSSHNRL